MKKTKKNIIVFFIFIGLFMTNSQTFGMVLCVSDSGHIVVKEPCESIEQIKSPISFVGRQKDCIDIMLALDNFILSFKKINAGIYPHINVSTSYLVNSYGKNFLSNISQNPKTSSNHLRSVILLI